MIAESPDQYLGCSTKHADRRLVFYTNAGGQLCYATQCQNCGHKSPNISHAEARARQQRGEPCVPFNEALANAESDRLTRAWEQARADREAQEELARQKWFKEYTEYLKTPAWKKKRAIILDRDNYTCQGCLSRPATDVHHRTYEHVTREFAFELISLCESCHERLHGHSVRPEERGENA